MTGPVRRGIFNGQPALSQGLKRATDLDGDGFGYLDPTIQASVTALDLADQQYNRLFDVFSYSGGRDVPAVVGQSGIFVLRNPAGSNKIMRVRNLTLNNPSALGAIWWGTISLASGISPALANTIAVTIGTRDTRLTNPVGGFSASAASLTVNSTAGALAIGQLVTMPAAASSLYSIDPLCTIVPNSYFYAFMGVANASFNASVAWDERLAGKQELNFPYQG